MRYQTIFTAFIVSIGFTVGQTLDLSNLKNAKKIAVSGSINWNNLYNSYVPVAINNYSYFVNGNVNFRVLDMIDVPLNLNFSNRKFSYSQPFSFNQISITPKYKWATGYFGTTAMTFSPYTLNGHQFRGVGFELMPKKWQIGLMAGRLISKHNDSTYNRMGYGLRLLYNIDKFRIGGTILHAADNPNSIAPDMLIKNSIRPLKNLVIGIEAGLNIVKIAQLDIEYSKSFVGEQGINTDYEKKGIENVFFKNDGAFRATRAFKTKLSKSLFNSMTIIGLAYERIDPHYLTFGGYFFTDDFENYTANVAQRLLQNKISFTGNVGLQRDILKTKSNGQSRLAAATTLNITPNEKFNANLSFSNFKGYTYIRDLVKETKRQSTLIPIDTLNYTQINRNTAVNASYMLSKDESRSQSVSFNASVLDAANKQGSIIRKGQASQVYNAQLSYTMSWTKSKTNLNVGYNYNQNLIGGNNLKTTGPVLSIQKSMLQEKLANSLSLSFLNSTDAISQSKANILNTNLNTTYTLSKKSKLVSNILILKTSDNQIQEITPLPTTIYTINIGYNQQF